MNKLRVFVCLLFALCATAARAQNPQTPATPPSSSSSSTSASASTSAPPAPVVQVLDVHTPAKIELSFGYTFRTYDGPLGNVGMSGGYVSGTYNKFRWLGVTGEALVVARREGDQSVGTEQNYTLATVMGGPQFYPLRHHKLTPFANILVGGGGLHFYGPSYAGFGGPDVRSSALAYEAGAGVDLRIKAHWSVRLIQVDYGKTKFYSSGSGQGSTRFAIGAVYLIGQKPSK
jgi:hypothetical protein